MASYARLPACLRLVQHANLEFGFFHFVTPYLIDVWLDDYVERCKGGEIVEIQVSDFNYLFDTSNSRLIAAWGVSKGRHGGKRDASRMAGHPLSAGPLYHRGHAIPHTLGGTTDINLVPQLGSVNIGRFRPLEKLAVATAGSLYFTYWIYQQSTMSGDKINDVPIGVDQGLLIVGQTPTVTTHVN